MATTISSTATKVNGDNCANPVRVLSEEEVSGLTQKLQWRANNLATVVQVANHVYL